jgi:cyanophycinase
MPAPVPAGYTRGALVVIGVTTSATRQEQLLQRFWNEAGGYGARILLCAGPGMEKASNSYADQLRQMEAASVDQLAIQDRQMARMTEQQALVERATGILLLAPSSLHVAALLGGTQLATAIRRANAAGKTVAGAGPSAAVLCQHILTPSPDQAATALLLQRDLIQFAPGLGMVNRLLLAVEPRPQPASHQLAGLLTAVAYNPFLVGVDIEVDTGIVIYPDTTLEVFGANNVLIIDGHQITHTDVTTISRPSAGSVHGVQLHVLRHGQTFTFDTHAVKAQPPTDIPVEGAPNHQLF